MEKRERVMFTLFCQRCPNMFKFLGGGRSIPQICPACAYNEGAGVPKTTRLIAA